MRAAIGYPIRQSGAGGFPPYPSMSLTVRFARFFLRSTIPPPVFPVPCGHGLPRPRGAYADGAGRDIFCEI